MGKTISSKKEDSGFVLPKARKENEFIIAAKFLTTRVLNMEAVGRTFKQLWWCSDSFKIRNLNDHKALFVFDDELDVKRYDKDIPQSSLTFDTVMFWV